ncbi:MAG: hypothetical protein ACLFQX_12430, partial [Candidatus Kapaibacterium sp.]
ARTWVERSIELNSNYANQDTYAAILYKLGEYEKALKHANLALEMARKEGKETPAETVELREKIKAVLLMK